MGGKGQRRREKNYKAAHGGYSRLPPPPKPNEVDVLPSKLRKLIEFTAANNNNNNNNNKEASVSTDTDSKNKNTKRDDNKVKANPKDESSSKTHTSVVKARHKDGNSESVREEASNKKKGKRKRKQVEDLRFVTEDLASYGLKKKEKRKKRSEAKKNKHKKAKVLEGSEFPGHEEIKFGDVVDAPPKLPAVTKGFKKIQDASHERLRLQAVEAYRNRKGWGSRPGILLPHIISNPSV